MRVLILLTISLLSTICYSGTLEYTTDEPYVQHNYVTYRIKCANLTAAKAYFVANIKSSTMTVVDIGYTDDPVKVDVTK